MTPTNIPANKRAESAVDPIDALVAAIDRVGSPVCVGIDPVFGKLPDELRVGEEVEAIDTFCMGVLDAVADLVPTVKPQSACFERFGPRGYAVLEKVIARARELGLVVILDAKRGDIGSSAQHYAAGAAAMGAHFITVSPYMGPSTIEPFLDAGLGVFALVRTSNPDSDAIQLLPAGDAGTLAGAVASMIADMGRASVGPASGLSALGAVVGATKSAGEGARFRAAMPDQMMLVPGVGAQGGTVEGVRPLLRADARTAGQLGVVINASRSVLYSASEPGETWADAVHRAARSLGDDLRALVP